MSAAVRMMTRHVLVLALCWGQTGCMLPQPDTPPIPPVFRPGGPGLPLAPAPAESLNVAPVRADSSPPPETGVDLSHGAVSERMDPTGALGAPGLSPVAGVITGDAAPMGPVAGKALAPSVPGSSVSSGSTEIPSEATTATATLYIEIAGGASSVSLRSVNASTVHYLATPGSIELLVGDYELEVEVAGRTLKASEPVRLQEKRQQRLRVVIDADGVRVESLDG